MSGVLSAFFVGGLPVLLILGGICIYVLQVIGLWKVLDKAGEEGWKAIIPLYNLWLQCKLTWSTRGFWVMMAALVLGCILRSANNGFCSAAGVILILAAFVLLVLAWYWLCRAFGHGVGYMVLFVFFAGIMYMVLGFSEDDFLGKEYEGFL